MKTKFIIPLLLIALSCNSLEKQIKKGNYEQAIATAVSKLRGKNDKSPKVITALREAYSHAIVQDLDAIEKLKTSSTSDKELKILRLYEKIDQYQKSIQPLLPLQDKDGNITSIELIDVAGHKAKYQDMASEKLYENALNNLKQGTISAARNAYSQLLELERISDRADIKSLKAEAKEKGTQYYLVKSFIGKGISLSQQATETFLEHNYKSANTDWKQVHYAPERGRSYHYEIEMVFTFFDISPEREKTREYQDKKTIDVETDRKDRDGKKILEKKEVVANVVELYQSKEIVTQATFHIFDVQTGKEIDTQNVQSKKLFENYASTYKGDVRALSDITKKRIGGKPLPFPTNEQMLYDVIQVMKSDLFTALKKGIAKQ